MSDATYGRQLVLTQVERMIRSFVRNFLCGLTREECVRELTFNESQPDMQIKARFIREWIEELDAEQGW